VKASATLNDLCQALSLYCVARSIMAGDPPLEMSPNDLEDARAVFAENSSPHHEDSIRQAMMKLLYSLQHEVASLLDAHKARRTIAANPSKALVGSISLWLGKTLLTSLSLRPAGMGSFCAGGLLHAAAYLTNLTLME